MTESLENDWTSLSVAWRSAPASVLTLDDLRRRENLHRCRMGLLVTLEILVSAAAIGITLLARRRWSEPAATLVVVSVFAYVAVIWAFAIWNRRGTWRSLAESTEAFLAISILRCRRGLRSARFVVAVVVVQLVGAVAWSALGVLTGRSPFAMTPRGAWAFGLLAGLALAFFGWAIWYRRRMIRELAWLVELRRGLAGEG